MNLLMKISSFVELILDGLVVILAVLGWVAIVYFAYYVVTH